MARQKPTNPDTPDWTLTPQQETAVDLLASGKTVTDTATAVEVTRQTVSEWLNHHPGFQAALNSRRQELWAGMTDALRDCCRRPWRCSSTSWRVRHRYRRPCMC